MEEFKMPSQPRTSNEIVNGVTYRVATLRKVALFPTRNGELTIEPMVISVDALVREKKQRRSIFDDFFDDPFGRTVKKTLSSKPVVINIKSFPIKNQPPEFDGDVGDYTISLRADKSELKANEAVSINLQIQGTGNLKLLKAPQLQLPSDMEIYDPKETTNVTRDNNKIGGRKSIEYVIVPRFKGSYKINPAVFSYFDPKQKKYVLLSTDPITLNVLEGDTPAAGLIAGSSLSKQEVALLGEDIRYIKESTEFYRSGVKLYQNWWYLFGYLLPLCGLALAWRYNNYRNRLKGDVQLARRRKAGKIAAKHLIKARQTLKSPNKEEFYRETNRALQGFVCDRLNIQISDFSSVNVTADLEGAGLGETEIDEYLSCLQESDFQRYSGSASDEKELRSFYERVKKILTRLEDYI
jgi:hypothetical protein